MQWAMRNMFVYLTLIECLVSISCLILPLLESDHRVGSGQKNADTSLLEICYLFGWCVRSSTIGSKWRPRPVVLYRVVNVHWVARGCLQGARKRKKDSKQVLSTHFGVFCEVLYCAIICCVISCWFVLVETFCACLSRKKLESWAFSTDCKVR